MKKVIRMNITVCTDEDKRIFEEVVAKGYGPINIFRAGMIALLKEEDKFNAKE